MLLFGEKCFELTVVFLPVTEVVGYEEAQYHDDDGECGGGIEAEHTVFRQHIGDHGEKETKDYREGGGIEVAEQSAHGRGDHHCADGNTDEHGQQYRKVEIREGGDVQFIQSQRGEENRGVNSGDNGGSDHSDAENDALQQIGVLDLGERIGIGSEEEISAHGTCYNNNVIEGGEAVFLHFTVEQGHGAENETEESETCGDFVIFQQKVQYLAERQHADAHAEEQGGEKAYVFLEILEKSCESIQSLLIQTEDDQQHAAAEPGRNAANAGDDTFEKCVHVGSFVVEFNAPKGDAPIIAQDLIKE